MQSRKNSFHMPQSLTNTFRVLAVCVLVVIVMSALGFGRSDPLTLEVDDETLVMTMYYEETPVVRIPRDDIQALELYDEVETGEAVEAVADDEEAYLAGTWENELWGEYTLYIDPSIEKYLLVTTSDGKYLINYESESSTESLCQALNEW